MMDHRRSSCFLNARVADAPEWAHQVVSHLIGCIFVPSSREIMARLKRAGFREIRSRGSHKVFTNVETRRTVVVKHPTKDYPVGTLKSMERQSGI